MSEYILWLHEVEMNDVDRVGGKNASLGEMLRNLTADGGVKVPGGFATTAHAYREFLAHEGLADRINSTLAALNVDDVGKLTETGRAIRQWVMDTPFPPALDAVVLKALEKKAEDRFATAGEMAKALAEAFQPAGAMSVSEWVREVAKDTLAARARRVAEVESHSATGAELTEADPGEVTQHANATDHTASVVGVPKTSSRPMVWGLAGAVVVLLGIVWFMAARSTAQPIAAPVTAASPAPPVVRSAPPVAAATPSAVPTASAAPAASEQGAVSSPPPRKVVRRPALEKAAPAKTAKPTKAAKPGCDPPYTVDGQGEKVFKPECF